MIGGVNTAKEAKLPPVPRYPARIARRAEGSLLDKPRARLVLSHSGDVEKIDAKPGVVLLIEIEDRELLEVLSAEVYAVHPGGIIDCYTRGEIVATTSACVLYRTRLGRTQ